jgi:hypothetical protein
MVQKQSRDKSNSSGWKILRRAPIILKAISFFNTWFETIFREVMIISEINSRFLQASRFGKEIK